MKLFIGIDLGLRSNGIVAIDEFSNLVQLKLISSQTRESDTSTKIQNAYNNEALLSYINYNVCEFIYYLQSLYNVNIAIERLSYNSISSTKDILAGAHWSVRTSIFDNFNIVPTVISPTKWRKNIYTASDAIDLQLKFLHDDINKIAPYELCPIKNDIDLYLSKYTKMYACKTDARFDLSDAYWIANYLKNNA